ncbi:MAG: 2-C-methyl-D-erythritol 2,4-cyclodiphosphate synthase [Acidimicrobiia bacterium]
MAETRVGIGYDVHRFDPHPPILIGGVIVDHERGVEATSDGDVVCHAISDGILGAANLGDMGMHFPSSDPRWHEADSIEMLRECVRMASAKGVEVVAVDVTVISQSVRIGPHREAIREGLAGALGIEPERVSVKATSTDGVGALGRDEGLAAMAVVTAVVG